MKTCALFQVLLCIVAGLSLAQGEHIQGTIRRGQVHARGVNLGGWLVAEHWMSYDSVFWNDVPKETRLAGEFATMKHHGKEKGTWLSYFHQANWITEKDIAEIASFGINLVRVPVGYWIVGFDKTDFSSKKEWEVYTPYGLIFLDKLVNEWAVKHNVAVLVDLHAHKGSQNGRDHSSAPSPGVKYWSEYPENVENSIQTVTFLAERYRNSPAFLGIDLMNEPEYPTNGQVLRDYYQRVYKLIRATGNDCVLVVSPHLSEQNPGAMQDFMRYPAYFNVWHQWHPYFIWGYEGRNEYQILDAVAAYGRSINQWGGNSLFIGEWSMGSPESAPFSDNNLFRRFGEEQRAMYRKAHAGWTFWSWRHSDDTHNKRTGWSLRALLRSGQFKMD